MSANNQPPSPDNFECYGATGNSKVGMFVFYVVVIMVAVVAVLSFVAK